MHTLNTTVLYEPKWILTPGEGEPGARLEVYYHGSLFSGQVTQKGQLLGEINDLPPSVTDRLGQYAFCDEPGRASV